MTMHGASPNRSVDLRRRAFAGRWLGDDLRFAVRPDVTSPPFPDGTLTHGDVLDHPAFPLVYPHPAD